MKKNIWLWALLCISLNLYSKETGPLVISIGLNYKNDPALTLENAIKSSKIIEDGFIDSGSKVISLNDEKKYVSVKLLEESISEAMKEYDRNASFIVVYFAGHGYFEKNCFQNECRYTQYVNLYKDDREITPISINELMELLHTYSTKTLLILDACRTYSRSDSQDSDSVKAGEELDAKKNDYDRYILTSVKEYKPANDNTAFAEAFKKTLIQLRNSLKKEVANVKINELFEVLKREKSDTGTYKYYHGFSEYKESDASLYNSGKPSNGIIPGIKQYYDERLIPAVLFFAPFLYLSARTSDGYFNEIAYNRRFNSVDRMISLNMLRRHQELDLTDIFLLSKSKEVYEKREAYINDIPLSGGLMLLLLIASNYEAYKKPLDYLFGKSFLFAGDDFPKMYLTGRKNYVQTVNGGSGYDVQIGIFVPF